MEKFNPQSTKLTQQHRPGDPSIFKQISDSINQSLTDRVVENITPTIVTLKDKREELAKLNFTKYSLEKSAVDYIKGFIENFYYQTSDSAMETSSQYRVREFLVVTSTGNVKISFKYDLPSSPACPTEINITPEDGIAEI